MRFSEAQTTADGSGGARAPVLGRRPLLPRLAVAGVPPYAGLVPGAPGPCHTSATAAPQHFGEQ